MRPCYLFKETAFWSLEMCNLAEILCDILAFLVQSAMHEYRSRPLLLSTKIMVKTMHFPQPQVVIKRALETVFHSLSNDISLIREKSLTKLAAWTQHILTYLVLNRVIDWVCEESCYYLNQMRILFFFFAKEILGHSFEDQMHFIFAKKYFV